MYRSRQFVGDAKDILPEFLQICKLFMQATFPAANFL